MHYTAIADNGTILIAAIKGERVIPLVEPDRFYSDLSQWTATDLDNRPSLALADVKQVPAVSPGARVLCVGLNYRAHAMEGGFTPPEYPAIFGWTPACSDSVAIVWRRSWRRMAGTSARLHARTNIA